MIFNETAKTCQRRAIEIDVMGEISLTCLFTRRNRRNKSRLLWEYLTFFYFYFEVFKTPCPLFHPRVKTQGLHCFFFLLNYPFMTYSWSNICLHCEKLPKTNVLKKLNPSIYIYTCNINLQQLQFKLHMISSSSFTFNSRIPVTEKFIEMVLGSEYNPHCGWVRNQYSLYFLRWYFLL